MRNKLCEQVVDPSWVSEELRQLREGTIRSRAWARAIDDEKPPQNLETDRLKENEEDKRLSYTYMHQETTDLTYLHITYQTRSSLTILPKQPTTQLSCACRQCRQEEGRKMPATRLDVVWQILMADKRLEVTICLGMLGISTSRGRSGTDRRHVDRTACSIYRHCH